MGKKVKKKGRLASKDKQSNIHSPKSILENADSFVEDVHCEEGKQKEKKPCPHLEKGFDIAKFSEKFKSTNPCRCEECREAMSDRRGHKGKGKQGKKKSDVSKAVWICLQCGHFSCGGVGLPGTQSHAFRHHKLTRHILVIQLENSHLRWCFKCDTFFPSEIMDEDGVKRDVLLDVVKLIKLPVSEKNSVDSKDTWLENGNPAAEVSRDYSLSSTSENATGYLVRGLTNLGNTCFFNSVLQNLLALKNMRNYFLHQDVSFGPLTTAVRKIFTETKSDTGLRNVMNPRSLFGCVCSKAPQFRGYQQQDSHELLRYLLDGLSTEELAAMKKDSDSTFVDSTFGGQVSSTVTCTECGYSSTVFEPFLDLSLPVSRKKHSPKRVLPPRSKKTKLPPKRFGKNRSKVSNDKNPDTLSVSESSPKNAADSTSSDTIIQDEISSEKTPDSSYDFSWMDFIETGNSCLDNGFSDKNHVEEPDMSLLHSEGELPNNVSPSEVLLLPKELSVLEANEDQGFDGFSELFNEPEDFSPPVSEVAESGFVADSSSESDEEEVNNSDTPISVETCLLHYIKPELLANDNAWECEKCCKSSNPTDENGGNISDDASENSRSPTKVKRDAIKRVLINKAPLILTIHLKRFFQDARGRLSKLNGHVNFEEILNLDPFMDPRCVDKGKCTYRLIGVVEHMGTMRQGHYVAYVRGSVWFHASDAHVREVSFGEVLRSEAYILFYEKI